MIDKKLYEFIFNKIFYDFISYIVDFIILPVISMITGMKRLKDVQINIGSEKIPLDDFLEQVIKFIIFIIILKYIF